MIELTLKNKNIIQLASPITIKELKSDCSSEIVGGILNGKVHDLNYKIRKSGIFEWIEKDSKIGRLMMERTLSFVFITAVKKCFPEAEITIHHTYAAGLFITIKKEPALSNIDIQKIKTKMQFIIDSNTPIQRRVVCTNEAVAHFEKLNMHDKAQLLKQRTSSKSSIYTCLNEDNYFYGVMATHAGMIDSFTLIPYHHGVWLSHKADLIEQPKLFESFMRFERRGKEIGLSNAWQLNKKILNGELNDLILANEQRIEDDLNDFVHQILSHPEIKVILIAGPSSAGKTTTSKRICEKLMNADRPSLTLAMDDFFLDRIDSPRLPDGSYDYENIECVDLKLFKETIDLLLEGKAVALPVYDFASGKKTWPNPPVTITSSHLLIIEGIHALNPRSSDFIMEHQKFKLYINALTHLNYDSHNRIPTSDYRMIRRMTRDAQFRGRSAAETILGWDKVTDGEEQYIYPYQEEADVIINTSMDYELPMLKVALLPKLNEITIDNPAYIEANRIRKLLEYFVDGDPSLVPNTSILKEFLGGSIYTG